MKNIFIFLNTLECMLNRFIEIRSEHHPSLRIYIIKPYMETEYNKNNQQHFFWNWWIQFTCIEIGTLLEERMQPGPRANQNVSSHAKYVQHFLCQQNRFFQTVSSDSSTTRPEPAYSQINKLEKRSKVLVAFIFSYLNI